VSARRRGLVLLALALACGGLAASRVSELERDVEARVGPTLPVVVAARDLDPDDRIPRAALAVARVPARYVAPDALATLTEAAGARTATALPRGSQVTASRLQGARRDRPAGALRSGERAIELAVSGGEALAAAPPGAHVDVIVSSERGASGARSVLALEGVELLGVRPPDGAGGDAGEGAAAAATALATLRVSVRQAVYLATAESFAGEVRLLVRPPGDRHRVGTAAVGAGEL
jgi:pilus assembly protein CpaB